MNVQIITIGDEILIGQTIDTNSAWMGEELNLIGATVDRIYSIQDDIEEIQKTLEIATSEADAVLMTGGLGPTKDDITKKAIASFLGVGLVFDQGTYDRILHLFEKWGREPTPAHREQCFMPATAQLLLNKMGTAPGMWFDYGDKVIVSMPGVPYEMKYLMEHQVIPGLRAKFPGRPIAHRTILTVGEGESRIAKRIESFEENLPKEIKLAYLPSLGTVRLRLTGRGADEEKLNKSIDQKKEELNALLPDLIFGQDKDSLPAYIGLLLKENDLQLGLAESCTGGYLGHMITSIAGSSAYFKGGVIAYSNELKKNLLGVKEDTLKQFGAVSEQTVGEMVRGAIHTLKVDVAVGVTGIAGPGGGTPEKPVGTVWLGVGDKNRVITRKLQIGKNRLKNIQYTGVMALNMLRQFVLNHI